MSVQTSTSEDADDGANDGLPGETKRPGERRTAAGGVATTGGTGVTKAKESSRLMGVNPPTRAAGKGEDAGAAATTEAAAAGASRPWGGRNGGKRPEKPACAGPEPTNGSSTARMAARDIMEGREGAEKGPREGSVSKGERERKGRCGLDAMVLMAARRGVARRKKETRLVKVWEVRAWLP